MSRLRFEKLGQDGAALRQATALVDALEIDRQRMLANIEATDGLVLAEAASFALSEVMPRPEAQALVKAACRDVLAGEGHLIDLLAARCDADIDWDALRDPAAQLGSAEVFIDRVLDARAG